MRTLRIVTLLALGLAAAPPSPASPGDARDRAVVVVRAVDLAAFERTIVALEAQGARLPHRIPPTLLAGFVPPGLEDRFVPPAGVAVEFERPAAHAAAGARLRDLPPVAEAMRRFAAGPRAAPALPDPRPFGGDLVEALPSEQASAAKHFEAPECGRPAATSAFLVGSVAIGIAMPESVGLENTEDWSNPDGRPAHAGDDRQDLVVAEIMEGCDMLAATLPLANLSFYYDVHRAVPIDVEPINRTVSDRGSWIAPTLESMGYGARAEVSGVGGWMHDIRERFDTDWAAAAFVVDDLNDADNGFPPTGFPFAYALLGGPYMVMTYDNDGWSIDRMSVVFRHELGHVFHALDEYRSAGNTCGRVAGYLPTKNANNVSDPGPPADPDCLSSVACVMRANSGPEICEFTLGQIGIRDLDADGIPDVRDAPPSSRFDGPATLLLPTGGTTLTGLVSGRATGGESPHAPVTYFVNRVTAAEWSLDGGPWLALAADDGAFGGRCEAVTVTVAGLAEGWHSVLLRGTNDVGLLEPSPAEVRIYVNTDCPDDPGEPDDDASVAVARPAGIHGGLHHCAFDADWSRFHLTAGAAITLTLRYDEALADLTLRLVDAALADIESVAGSAGVATITAIAPRSSTYYAVVDGAGEGESDYTLEIDAACIDDPGEPDGSPTTGQPVVPGTIRDLSLCPADLDHFLISVQAGENVAATITFDPGLGNLDLELLDPSGTSVSTSAGSGGSETVTATPTIEGTYAIRVFGRTPADRDVYALDVVATGCIDDAGENDDTAAAARPLPADVRATICDGDEDWYAFDVAVPSLVRVQLSQDPAGADLEVELLDAAGRATLGRGIPQGDFDDLTRESLVAGSYRVRVHAPAGGGARYRLTFQAEDPILLFVHRDAHDALLSWNEAGQECYVYRRSEDPSDFGGGITRIVNEDDPSVPDTDRAIEDISYRDRDVVFDGRFLYCYLISPADCGGSLVGSTKTANPYPVASGIGTTNLIEYTITVANGGVDDVFRATVRDDIPMNVSSFSVLEIPPGATDATVPAPAGAFGRGLIVVTGIDVPAGQSRTIRFQVLPDRNTTMDLPVISNQASIEHGGSPATPPTVTLTDDPATSAFPDDTRVIVPGFWQTVRAHAFWHRQVDIDLRMIDTCGNIVGEHDMSSATCSGATLDLFNRHSCRAPGDRYEAIWARNVLPPGTYRVEVAYVESAEDDAGCTGRGVDEVTVVLQTQDFRTIHRTIALMPGEGPVLAFEYSP